MQINVETDEVLSELSTQELLEELEARNLNRSSAYTLAATGSVTDAITVLRAAGMPCDLLQRVDEWAHEPVVTTETLERWLELCGRAQKVSR